MTYEWDEAKNQYNLVKHGIDFADIERFDWDHAVSIPSNRHGESRIASIGSLDGLLHFVMYTIRGAQSPDHQSAPGQRQGKETV